MPSSEADFRAKIANARNRGWSNKAAVHQFALGEFLVARGRIDEAADLIAESINSVPDAKEVADRFALLLTIAPKHSGVSTALSSMLKRPEASRHSLRAYVQDKLVRGHHVPALRALMVFDAAASGRSVLIASEVDFVIESLLRTTTFKPSTLRQIATLVPEKPQTLAEVRVAFGVAAVYKRLIAIAELSGNTDNKRMVVETLGVALARPDVVRAQLTEYRIERDPMFSTTSVVDAAKVICDIAMLNGQTRGWEPAITELGDLLVPLYYNPGQRSFRRPFFDSLATQLVSLGRKSAAQLDAPGFQLQIQLLKIAFMCMNGGTDARYPRNGPAGVIAQFIFDLSSGSTDRFAEALGSLALFSPTINDGKLNPELRGFDYFTRLSGNAPKIGALSAILEYVGNRITKDRLEALVDRHFGAIGSEDRIESELKAAGTPSDEIASGIAVAEQRGHRHVKTELTLQDATQARLSGNEQEALAIELAVYPETVATAFHQGRYADHTRTDRAVDLGRRLVAADIPLNELLDPIFAEIATRTEKRWNTKPLQEFADQLRVAQLVKDLGDKIPLTQRPDGSRALEALQTHPVGPRGLDATLDLRRSGELTHTEFASVVEMTNDLRAAVDALTISVLVDIANGRDPLATPHGDPAAFAVRTSVEGFESQAAGAGVDAVVVLAAAQPGIPSKMSVAKLDVLVSEAIRGEMRYATVASAVDESQRLMQAHLDLASVDDRVERDRVIIEMPRGYTGVILEKLAASIETNSDVGAAWLTATEGLSPSLRSPDFAASRLDLTSSESPQVRQFLGELAAAEASQHHEIG